MINTKKLNQIIKEENVVVVHSFNENQHKLLYKGNNQQLGSDQYFNFSGLTRIFLRGKEVRL